MQPFLFFSEYKFFTCLDIRFQYFLCQKTYLVSLFRGPQEAMKLKPMPPITLKTHLKLPMTYGVFCSVAVADPDHFWKLDPDPHWSEKMDPDPH
jgi:hypothetical protein